MLQRAYGIERANGEYISFVDSDDYAHPLLLDFVAQKIENENIDVLCYSKNVCKHQVMLLIKLNALKDYDKYYSDTLKVRTVLKNGEERKYNNQCYIYSVFGAISLLLSNHFDTYKQFKLQFTKVRNNMKKHFNTRSILCREKEFSCSEILLALSLNYNYK